MNRFKFGLILCATGFPVAFLGPRLAMNHEPAWDPQEVESALFSPKPGLMSRPAAHPDLKATLGRWERPTVPLRGALDRSSRPMGGLIAGNEPRGARVRLVSFTNTLSPLLDYQEPDNDQPPPFASILNASGYSNTCSTKDGAETWCSVQTSKTGGACSADSDGAAWCSAAKYDTALTSQCSVINNTTATATCSTNGNNTQCSTNSQNGGSGLICSTIQGSKQNCSTGAQAGGGSSGHNNEGQTGTACSALFAAGGNFCSVSGTAANNTNLCSADNSTATFCSVESTPPEGSQASDFCSVQAGQTNVKCTTIGNGGKATCSVKEGSNGSCSVQGGGGTVQGGICSLP